MISSTRHLQTQGLRNFLEEIVSLTKTFWGYNRQHHYRLDIVWQEIGSSFKRLKKIVSLKTKSRILCLYTQEGTGLQGLVETNVCIAHTGSWECFLWVLGFTMLHSSPLRLALVSFFSTKEIIRENWRLQEVRWIQNTRIGFKHKFRAKLNQITRSPRYKNWLISWKPRHQ